MSAAGCSCRRHQRYHCLPKPVPLVHVGSPHPVLIGTNHFSMSDSAISLELEFCVAAAALILAISDASIVSSTGSPAFSVYSATKAAVRSFARTWSVDLKDRKIRVNAISPGIIPTPGYNTSLGMTQEQVDQFVQSSIGNIPLGRPGTADE